MVTVHKIWLITSVDGYLSIFDGETCYHFLCQFIHLCDLAVAYQIFLSRSIFVEVLSCP